MITLFHFLYYYTSFIDPPLSTPFVPPNHYASIKILSHTTPETDLYLSLLLGQTTQLSLHHSILPVFFFHTTILLLCENLIYSIIPFQNTRTCTHTIKIFKHHLSFFNLQIFLHMSLIQSSGKQSYILFHTTHNNICHTG